MNLINHLTRQLAFSLKTFGPADLEGRLDGVLDHIEKEIVEVREDQDPEEWVDLVILSCDGLTRTIAQRNPDWSVHRVAKEATRILDNKMSKNIRRNWPDWRTSPPGKAIEHVRGIHD